jgi:hypothetical protein
VRPVTTITALVELLVGAICVAIAVPWWRRPGVWFRVLAICLAVAGAVAIANAIFTLVR